jgi:S1-C subfamily serine protease
MEIGMKKYTFSITGIALILAITISACSAATLLSGQAVSSAAQNAAQNANPVAAPTLAPQAKASRPVSQAPAPVEPGLLAAYEGTLEDLYARVNPSVVNIQVLSQAAGSANSSPGFPFFNMPGLPGNQGQPGGSAPQSPQFSQALGSGFVWDTQGDIVTNNHVIDGADKIEVTFYDGTAVPAKLVGADPYSDLAVVKVDVPASQLNPVTLIDSTQVKVGQLGIAIGNPYGLQGTMTVGIVSGLGRSLPVDIGATQSGSYTIPDIVQTDAPINPGNSGGVLVGDQGQVIGVTSAIESPTRANAGIGFVIPATIVQKVVPALIQDGKIDHPWLGISGTSLTPDLAQAMGLKADQRGALVQEVVQGSPAEQAGLRASDKAVTIDGQSINVGGDVVIGLDGEVVQKMDDLIALLFERTQVRQNVTLTVLRGGKEISVQITLAARPAATAQPAASNAPAGPQASGVWLGILGAPVTPEIARAMSLPSDQQGVLVEQVQPGSPAEKAGLQGGSKQLDLNGQSVAIGGDIILALDGQSVAQVSDLRSLLGQYQPGQEATLTILRDGKQQDVKVTLAEQPIQ